MNREQLVMLKRIMALKFTVLEFNLYLNTHPQDSKALRDHNQYVKELMDLRMDYQEMYGPLTPNYPSECPWQYPKTEWPWQIDY